MNSRMLTDRDYLRVDAFIGFILDSFVQGQIARRQAAIALSDLIRAIDDREAAVARSMIEQGREFVAKLRSST